jgi:peptidoglycan-associated lipoprotein
MKISKQHLLITPILFLFFAIGCSKNISPTINTESKSDYVEPNPEFFKEENVGEFDTVPDSVDSDKKESGLLGEVGDTDTNPDHIDLFLPKKEGNSIISLSPEEEARRQLPYRASNHLSDMFFAFDSYDLDEQLLTSLQANATYLQSHPFSRIVLHGHCDERGSNNYNLSLGNERANSVKSYLILLGINESRIHTVSYGEEKPFCFENNENCWYQNRRVSILIAEKIDSAAFKLKVKTNSLVMLKK